jgi:hypothetical protein
MIIFDGFPNDEIMIKDIKVDFDVSIIKGLEKIYEEKMNTHMEDEQIKNIILGIDLIIDKYEGEKFVLTNLIEFLIWFDKKSNQYNSFVSELIQKYAKLTDTPNLLKIILNYPSDIAKYDLNYLIEDFMKLDFHLYNDNTFILLLQQICKVYERNYKDDVINIMKRYINEKAVEKININFNKLDEGDIINIINGHLTQKNIQSELDHLNFLMELAILNEEK